MFPVGETFLSPGPGTQQLQYVELIDESQYEGAIRLDQALPGLKTSGF